ncbi:MAG: gliding motility-associated C-terminal domain-containing protein [Salinivirgaceae bacterium]
MELRKGLYMLLLFLGSFPFTLKAQQPEPPTILQLDVFENGHVEIVYEYSKTEGVDYYVIKRNHQEKNLVGTGDLDTIPPDISQRYLDNTARADTASYTYEMYSIKNDTSGNVPPEGSSTIFLKSVSYDTCANSVRLNWSPYIGWGENNPKYEIYINNKGLGFLIGDTSYQVRNVIPGETYQFHIRAKKSSANYFSNSNRVTLTIPELKKPDQLFITAVENTGTEVKFTVAVDPEADLSGHQLGYSTTAQGVYEALLFNPKNSENTLSFTQSATNPSGFYKVSAINSCNKPVDSTEAVCPLVLDYSQQDLDVVLHWNTTFIEGAETYDLFLSIDNSDFIKQETNWSGTSINYTLDGSSFGDANSELFCFYVVANSNMGQQSRSNTICLTRQPKVYLPTAFTPNGDGVNDFILPEILNVSVVKYLFVVYDKYGGKVFETKSTHDKWWGRAGTKNVSEGAYLYYLEFETSQGVAHKQSGAINVVYP